MYLHRIARSLATLSFTVLIGVLPTLAAGDADSPALNLAGETQQQRWSEALALLTRGQLEEATDLVHALTADGWTITDDPLTLSYGGKDLFVDLGAERSTLAAERGGEKIAVEVQSFLNPSPVRDLEEAVGQYNIYQTVLAETEPDRQLYLAVANRVYEGLLSDRFGQLIVTRLQLRILVFDEQIERIVQWIK